MCGEVQRCAAFCGEVRNVFGGGALGIFDGEPRSAAMSVAHVSTAVSSTVICSSGQCICVAEIAPFCCVEHGDVFCCES